MNQHIDVEVTMGGTSFESDTDLEQQPIFNNLALDPAAFYEEVELDTLNVRDHQAAVTFQEMSPPSGRTRTRQADKPISTTDSMCSIARSTSHDCALNSEKSTLTCLLLHNLYRDKRREARVQGLEDVVILFAIPLLKRDGRNNEQWASAEIVCEDFGARAMVPRLHDPVNGDKIFSFVRPSETIAKDGDERVMKFYFRCPSSHDEDRPAHADHYSVPLSTPGLYSVRDGEVIAGDKIYDIGIILNLILPSYLILDEEVPQLHHFDECSGTWCCRKFVAKPDSHHTLTREFVCVLSGVRRTQFVVQLSPSQFLKSSDGSNMLISWPGSYVVTVNEQMSTGLVLGPTAPSLIKLEDLSMDFSTRASEVCNGADIVEPRRVTCYAIGEANNDDP